MNRLAAALALLALGCPARPPPGAVTPRPTSTTPTPAATRFTPEAIVATRAGAPAEEFSVAADGTVSRGGRPVARVEERRVVTTAGATLATLDGDGTIRVEGSRRTLRIDAGAVTRDDGLRLERAEDGRVVLRDASGAEAATPWRIGPGASPSGVATALILLAVMDGPGDASR